MAAIQHLLTLGVAHDLLLRVDTRLGSTVYGVDCRGIAGAVTAAQQTHPFASSFQAGSPLWCRSPPVWERCQRCARSTQPRCAPSLEIPAEADQESHGGGGLALWVQGLLFSASFQLVRGLGSWPVYATQLCCLGGLYSNVMENLGFFSRNRTVSSLPSCMRTLLSWLRFILCHVLTEPFTDTLPWLDMWKLFPRTWMCPTVGWSVAPPSSDSRIGIVT